MNRFEEQMRTVNTQLTGMSAMVEQQVQDAIKALLSANLELARQVISNDRAVDEVENQITDVAIRLLATNQPVAGDLRFLSSLFRLAADLERVADLAVNLAWRVVAINEEIELRASFSPLLAAMAEVAQKMLRQTLDALNRRNGSQALDVCRNDSELDDLHRCHRQQMIQFMQKRPELAAWGVEAILAGNYLERIGDHLTNLCEEIIYLVSGRVIRHCQT